MAHASSGHGQKLLVVCHWLRYLVMLVTRSLVTRVRYSRRTARYSWYVPVFRVPVFRDGARKNDCERNAAKRLLADLRRAHPHLKLIVVEDGLASNAPHIRQLQELNLRFILGVKPSDHTHLFAWVAATPATREVEFTDAKGRSCSYTAGIAAGAQACLPFGKMGLHFGDKDSVNTPLKVPLACQPYGSSIVARALIRLPAVAGDPDPRIHAIEWSAHCSSENSSVKKIPWQRLSRQDFVGRP
jgi:hypothetical protein